MVSGDLGFAWRFSPLDMPDQPMLEILQTHFDFSVLLLDTLFDFLIHVESDTVTYITNGTLK